MMMGYVVLTGVVEKEGNQFVSYCRELGVSSCGDTAEEALKSLGDAIDVQISALIETQELLRVFRERSIRIDAAPPLDEFTLRVPPGKIFTTYQHSVPVAEPV